MARSSQRKQVIFGCAAVQAACESLSLRLRPELTDRLCMAMGLTQPDAEADRGGLRHYDTPDGRVVALDATGSVMTIHASHAAFEAHLARIARNAGLDAAEQRAAEDRASAEDEAAHRRD